MLVFLKFFIVGLFHRLLFYKITDFACVDTSFFNKIELNFPMEFVVFSSTDILWTKQISLLLSNRQYEQYENCYSFKNFKRLNYPSKNNLDKLLLVTRKIYMLLARSKSFAYLLPRRLSIILTFSSHIFTLRELSISILFLHITI